jgi:serine/threonine-protein kinase HipA
MTCGWAWVCASTLKRTRASGISVIGWCPSRGDLEEIDCLLNGHQDGAGYLSFGLKLEPPAPKRRYNRTRQLADLVAAAEAIEEGKRVPEQILEQLEPGTSMGGARPKDP